MRLSLMLLIACAPDLRTLNRFRIVGAEFAEGVRFITQDNGDGSFAGQVNASDKVAWVYIDLQTAAEVSEADPWDLAFQRFNVRTQMGAIVLDNALFEDVTSREGALVGEDPFKEWYFYNLGNHTLVANEVVYVVPTPEGDAYKVRMLNYYDSTGTSGFPSFNYAALP